MDFVLLLFLGAAAMVLAAVSARALLAQPAGDVQARRLLAAVQQAGGSYGWAQVRHLAAGVAPLIAVAAVAWAAMSGEALTGAIWLGMGGALGLVLALAATLGSTHLGLRAAGGAALAVRARGHASLPRSFGGAAVLALTVEGLALLPLLLVLGYCLSGTPVEVAQRLHNAYASLLGASLSTTACALISHASGGAFFSAGESCRSHPALNPQGLRFPRGSHNPLLVVGVSAPAAALFVSRLLDLLCLSVLAHTVVLSAAIWLEGTESVDFPVVALLCIVFRGCSLLATAIVVVGLRGERSDDPAGLLWKAQCAAGLISLVGLFGASRWFLGESSWVSFSAAAAVGVIANLASSLLARERAQRGSAMARQTGEDLTSNSSFSLTRALSGAWSWLGLELVLANGCLAAAWLLGTHTGLMGGGVLALCMVTSGALSGLSLAGAFIGYEFNAEAGLRLASASLSGPPLLGSSALTSDVIATQNGAAGRAAVAHATTVLGMTSAVVCLIRVGGDFVELVPVALLGAALGISLVLFHASLSLRLADGAMLDSGTELDRQLRRLPRDATGALVFPDDFSPRYKDHLALAMNGALGSRSYTSLLVLGVPLVVLGTLGQMTALGGQVGVATLLAFSALAAIAVARTTDVSWSAPSGHPKRAPAFPPSATAAFNATSEALAERLARVAGSAATLAAKAAVACWLVAAALPLSPT